MSLVEGVWDGRALHSGRVMGVVPDAHGLMSHGEIPTRMVVDPKRPPGAESNGDCDQLAIASMLQIKKK